MNDLIKLVDTYLDEYLKIQYPKSIFSSMKYTLSLKGKRLRPVMCLETARMLGVSLDVALPAACALEMLHVQSLIHDDLPCMDNDDFRRGKPSNHKVYGEATAVLAGDALLSLAPQLIIEKSEKLSAEQKLALVYEFVKAAGAYGLIAGQVVDIESEGGSYEKDAHQTLDFIHTNKTAVLFRLAVKMGVIIAKANDETTKALDDFALKFGLAFQIYDDIMDEVSTFEEMGKTLGKDKAAGKLTYISLYGLEGAFEKALALIKSCRGIIEKYDSKIFEEILSKIENKLKEIELC